LSKAKADLDHQKQLQQEAALLSLCARLQRDLSNIDLQQQLLALEDSINDDQLHLVQQVQQLLHLSWLSDRDQCTKRFFSILKARSASNNIPALSDDSGNIVYNTEPILNLATEYCNKVLNENNLTSAAEDDRKYLLA
jgi:hypothetical protein